MGALEEYSTTDVWSEFSCVWESDLIRLKLKTFVFQVTNAISLISQESKLSFFVQEQLTIEIKLFINSFLYSLQEGEAQIAEQER